MKQKFFLLVMTLLISLCGWADEQGYAVFDESTGTLTFKYGEKPEGENVFDTDNTTPLCIYSPEVGWQYNEDYNNWKKESWIGENYSISKIIKRVIFDESFANARPKSTSGWFTDCSGLKEIIGIENLNTSEVTDMSAMFDGCSSLTNIDLSHLNTENVTNMRQMFESCACMISIDLSSLKTNNVNDMCYMFAFCSGLTNIDLRPLNTENVKDMSSMFSGCSSLRSIDLSPLNTENVTDMGYMFHGCSSLTSIDLSPLNTEKVTMMNGLFSGCSSLTNIDLSPLNTEKVTNMNSLFSGCSSLTNIDLSPLNTENVIYMVEMFSGCSSLTSIDLNPLNTEKVTNMNALFRGCTGLTNIDLSSLKTGNVTSMNRMFYGCSDLISLDISPLNTSKVTNMSYMFSECSGLKCINLNSLNTENVTSMSYMFSGCSNLTYIDLTPLNTEKVLDMSGLFFGCSGLNGIDLNSFNTEKVTNMSYMFGGCKEIKDLNVNNFNTGNVTDYGYMFSYCSNIESIDISSFNTKKATNVSGMFGCCNRLKSVFFGKDFSLDNVPDFQKTSGNEFDGPFLLDDSISYIRMSTDVTTLKDRVFDGGQGSSVGRDTPAILDVPEKYLLNYKAKCSNNYLYGGRFIIKSYLDDETIIEPSTPVFNRKKLLSISQDGYENRRVDFEYDEQGRVRRFTHTRSDKLTIYDYTYDGDNIIIACGSSKYEYLINNGRVKSGSWYLSQDYATEEFAYLYNADKHMTQITNLTNNSSAKKYVYSWDAGNPTSISFYRNNELRVQTDFSYNQITSEPMIHAIFGFGEGEGLYLDEIFDEVALYPYMGTLPKNLFAHNKVKEVRNGSYSGEYGYSFDYETNEKGDIVKVIINKNVYHLEWEDNYTTDEDIATTNKGSADYGEGGNINEQTDLNGNVINNVYYNISSSNGGYNSTEGCIVVNTPTKEDDIDGKDIFGEDFKNHFTGIVFKVAAGSGSIKVKAETVGGMLLKVRIGNNEPFEMMMKGSIAATFPYNVDKPTYVYIYAGSLSDMSRTRESSDSVLKIYGIEWESDVINGDANDDGIVNAADILKVVNYIMGNLSGNLNMDAADANGDGMVNTEDIVKIVNIIKGN